MPSLEHEFEVWCSCGEGLCNQTDTINKPRKHGIIVTPCQKCLDEAEEKGFNEGYEKGIRNGGIE